jgi:hypothetical protein
LKLPTRPLATGSVPTTKTIGIVGVALFATPTEAPLATIATTLRCARSSANAANRSR